MTRHRCIATDNTACAFASPYVLATRPSLIPEDADSEQIGHDGRWLYHDDEFGTVILQIPIAHGLLQVEFTGSEIRDLQAALRKFGFVRGET